MPADNGELKHKTVLADMMLREGSQMRKAAYCTIPLMGNVQSRPALDSESRSVSGCQGWAGVGNDGQWAQGDLWDDGLW